MVLDIHNEPLKRIIKLQDVNKSLGKIMGDYTLLVNE